MHFPFLGVSQEGSHIITYGVARLTSLFNNEVYIIRDKLRTGSYFVPQSARTHVTKHYNVNPNAEKIKEIYDNFLLTFNG